MDEKTIVVIDSDQDDWVLDEGFTTKIETAIDEFVNVKIETFEEDDQTMKPEVAYVTLEKKENFFAEKEKTQTQITN